jgi:endoglucanase
MAGEPMDIWWPVEGSVIKGTQPLKALLPNRAIDAYAMFWQVDRDRLNPMDSNYEGWPHKEATVDFSGWNWKGNGPYLITFTAKDSSGNVISERSVNITIESAASAPVQTVSLVSATLAESSASVTTEATLTKSSVPAISTVTETSFAVSAPVISVSSVAASVNVWWPVDGVTFSGEQPLKAELVGVPLADYNMYWQVETGSLNFMPDSYVDAPHKETKINLSGWDWKGAGPYRMNFIAKDKSGKVLSEKAVYVKIGTFAMPGTTAVTEPVAQPAPVPADTQVQAVSTGAATAQGNPFGGAKLYVNPYGDAKKQADAWRTSRPADAAFMDKLAAQPETFWMGGWNKDIEKETAGMVTLAKGQGALPVFVAYNIPYRDCGQFSAGGVATADAYRTWIRGMANGIGGNKAVVILEPDALTLTDCLSSDQRNERFNLIKDAISTLKSKGAAVYLDAGHARWVEPNEMAKRLTSAGIAKADGFSLNTSNFIADAESVSYGEKISAATGGKHFLIDSGRNGNGTNGEWCNPWGRALGRKPTAQTGSSLVDAFLWVKGPGGSDGNCNGGPNAGIWFPEYALQLVKNANW